MAKTSIFNAGSEDKIDKSRPKALVVEDEPLIAMNAVDMLEDLGYQALETFSADDALAVLRANNEIALVFTDIDMPGSMNGLGLAALVDQTWPDIRILIASGRAIPAAGEIPPKARFLTKPYASHHLALALKGMT
jgi:two-component system, response regulator PdtaR